MLTYVGTLHTCRRLSLNETATAFQADRVAFCKQTDFNGGPYRPLHDGGVGAGSQPTQSLATVFIIIFVFPSPRPLPCINKFMNSDDHQMAWTVRSARVYRIQRSKSIKLNTDSRVVQWQLEEKYISYHSPTIKNDITRSDTCKRRRNSVKSSDVGRQKVPCTS